MFVRAPPVQAKQNGSVGIRDLTKVIMGWRRLGLAKERLVPLAARRDIAYANDRPCAFHRSSSILVRMCAGINTMFAEYPTADGTGKRSEKFGAGPSLRNRCR
jgi:hypothetical protein